MRFMVIVPANPESEAGIMPNEQELAAMGKFNEEMAQAGVLLAGEGLHGSAKGARIRFSGSGTTVIDGPFSGPNLVAGFWLIQANSKAEAVEWMRRAPFADGTVLEIRQVLEAEDFGPALTPELREQEDRLRARTEARAARRP